MYVVLEVLGQVLFPHWTRLNERWTELPEQLLPPDGFRYCPVLNAERWAELELGAATEAAQDGAEARES